MQSRHVIKIKIVSTDMTFSQWGISYQIVANALRNLGGTVRHIERSELVKGVKEELDRLGLHMRNVDATVSSFCALDGVDPVVEFPGGYTEPFESKRKSQRLSKVATA